MKDYTNRTRRACGHLDSFFSSDQCYYYEFDDICDIRGNIEKIGQNIEIKSDDEIKYIVGTCANSTRLSVNDDLSYIFYDLSDSIKSVIKTKRIYDLLLSRNLIDSFCFVDLLYQDKSLHFYNRYDSLYVFSVNGGEDFNGRDSGPRPSDNLSWPSPLNEQQIAQFSALFPLSI